ncbi:DUF4912 domain-containing protein [Bullifex porci]|uniref:DUF4912 domain-containing protein n=1 Tax=Bullifex porci TaxID=2606638 RepID=UPI0023EFED24|nr:DUF4912 domain-containing protein [Bullifex porci]MDD7255703.1 DUF4912 domain-containing protein [Bullifex porci]MDY2742018.1 DUF4912 domain-containing protein [Bullifex porci]
MVLIKIDSLSQNELEYIAQQEGIKDFDTLSREELIDELKEIYDDDYSESLSVTGENVNKRYVAGLSAYRGDVNEELPSLPGVEKLPELYPETAIHVLNKNASWLYCYWSIAPGDLESYDLKFGSYELYLNVNVTGKDKSEKYDILIGRDDVEWNISVPLVNGECRVSLVLQTKEKRYLLAMSESVPLVYCYWLNNPIDKIYDEALFRHYVAPLTNRDGYIIPSDIVEEIVDKVKNEVEK